MSKNHVKRLYDEEFSSIKKYNEDDYTYKTKYHNSSKEYFDEKVINISDEYNISPQQAACMLCCYYNSRLCSGCEFIESCASIRKETEKNKQK